MPELRTPEPAPSVTVVITARDRPDELARTLRELKHQDYPSIAILVIDDASEANLQSVVQNEWPEAQFWRNSVAAGLIANRSRALAEVGSDYMVSLDDDSCFTSANDLSLAVARMEEDASLGILTFFIYQGPDPVPTNIASQEERYVSSFIGCGHMMRIKAVRHIGVYRNFYAYYGEESEYSLRMWDAGWRILLFGKVLIHHRVSAVGRSSAKILWHSTRNNLWTTFLHMPLRRLALQIPWRIFSSLLESLRVGHPLAFVRGIGSFMVGLPKVLSLRRPISLETLRLLDAIQATAVTSEHQLRDTRAPSLWKMGTQFFDRWRHRPRARSFWDKGEGHLGSSETAVFPHNLTSVSENQPKQKPSVPYASE